MNNKIYLIYEHCGVYEDYVKNLIKAFSNEIEAKKFKEGKEREAKEMKERFETKCSYCGLNDKLCKLYEEMEDDEDCANRIEYYDIENLHYTLEEIEVE